MACLYEYSKIITMESEINCPGCHAKAVYKYGKTKRGRQRYVCLMCGRQFTPEKERSEITVRPTCPVCGGKMHCYKRYNEILRFRCAGYPACKAYKKVGLKEVLST